MAARIAAGLETGPGHRGLGRERGVQPDIGSPVLEALEVADGDSVLTAECRPVAKSVAFVVVEVKK